MPLKDHRGGHKCTIDTSLTLLESVKKTFDLRLPLCEIGNRGESTKKDCEETPILPKSIT